MFSNIKNFQVPALVEPDKKKLPYTIIPIGNHDDLQAWRKNQELLAEARDSYIEAYPGSGPTSWIAGVRNQNLTFSPDKGEQDEIKYRTEIRPGTKQR